MWRHVDGRGAVCVALDEFEGERQFVQLGVNPFRARTGRPIAMYHWEADQEDFLVISGEAVLIIEPRDPEVAYAPFPRREPTAYRDGWLPEHPLRDV